MKVKLSPRWLSGSLSAVQSKSHLHRLLIANALSGSNQNIRLGQISDDIAATIECLNELVSVEAPHLYCNESGSTLRFLLPVTMALKDEAAFHGKGRLPERPLGPLKDVLIEGGCVFSDGNDSMFAVKGRLKSGRYLLPGNVSSQYITGLLFALPLVQGESKIVVSKPLESVGYINMTLQVLDLYGIRIFLDRISDEDNVIFTIPGGQEYTAPIETPVVEGDWSNSAFWLVAGAISRQGEGINVYGLSQNSAQGDKKIIDLLENFGAKVFFSEFQAFVSRDNLYGITIDASNIPDLVPILAVLASVSQGITRIIKADRVRIKESDRLHAISVSLNAIGGIVTELEDGLIINGVDSLTGGFVPSFNDHRIVMAMSMASCCCEGEIIIDGAEAINKSYPTFFDDFTILGGRHSYL